MRRVIIESPYAAADAEGIERHVRYARAACADSLRRGEAPWASHLLYTQPGILRDERPRERALGIEAGLVWGEAADATLVYLDLGISRGMELGIRRAVREGRVVELRALGRHGLADAIGPSATDDAIARSLPETARRVAQMVIDDERKQVA